MISGAGRWQIYWVHLVWVLYVFLYLVFFWWWEFSFATVTEWTFGLYLFVIFYAVLLYLLAVVLLPRGFPEGASFEKYYYSRRKWFFGLLLAIIVIDVADTLAKGWDYALNLGLDYWAIGITAYVLLFAAAIKSENRVFHAALAVGATLYLSYRALIQYWTIA